MSVYLVYTFAEMKFFHIFFNLCNMLILIKKLQTEKKRLFAKMQKV